MFAAQHLKSSAERLRSKFYSVFIVSTLKSNAEKSEWVIEELLKTYCLPFMLFDADTL